MILILTIVFYLLPAAEKENAKPKNNQHNQHRPALPGLLTFFSKCSSGSATKPKDTMAMASKENAVTGP